MMRAKNRLDQILLDAESSFLSLSHKNSKTSLTMRNLVFDHESQSMGRLKRKPTK